MNMLDAPEARCIAKVNSALSPLAEFGNHIFGKKHDRRGMSDELVVFRVWIGRDQPKHRGSIRRRDGHQAITGWKADVEGQMEPELIQVEIQAAILVSNKDIDSVNAQVG